MGKAIKPKTNKGDLPQYADQTLDKKDEVQEILCETLDRIGTKIGFYLSAVEHVFKTNEKAHKKLKDIESDLVAAGKTENFGDLIYLLRRYEKAYDWAMTEVHKQLLEDDRKPLRKSMRSLIDFFAENGIPGVKVVTAVPSLKVRIEI